MRYNEINESLADVTPDTVLNAFRYGPGDLRGLYHNYKLAFDDFDEWMVGRTQELSAALKPWSEGNVTLYRRLPTTSVNRNKLGIHWAIAPETNADVHYGDYVMQVTVPQAAINWPETMARAIGWWDSDQEITLRPGSRVVIARFYDIETDKTIATNIPATI